MKKQKEASLKSQSAGLLFAKVIGFGFAFLLPLVVVRYLSQDEVGVYRQAFFVLMNAISILSFGFSMSIYYYLSREEGGRAAAIINVLVFHFVMGGFAFFILFCFPQILGAIFVSDEMTNLAPLIGTAIWIWFFSTLLETVVIANKEAKLTVYIIVLSQFSKSALMIFAILIYENIESLIYAAIIHGIIQTIVLFVYLQSRFPYFWLQFSFSNFRAHFGYAVPFGFAGVIWGLPSDIHNYFVGNRFSDAEMAIYAYGCFQVPLITMLAESVTSVLIPKMSELQLKDDKTEMIRVTAKAMQKLAFFYFPIYVFLMITAETFIITLFTRDYAASIPIFLINLTLLPFNILVSDPIVRAYKEFGRFIIGLRIVMFIGLLIGLYLGFRSFGMQGIIGVVIAVHIIESIVAQVVIFKKLGINKNDRYLFKDIGITAIISLLSGLVAFVVYHFAVDAMPSVGEYVVGLFSNSPKSQYVDIVSGLSILGVSFLAFTPVYIFLSNRMGIIDEDEKDIIRGLGAKISEVFGKKAIQ